MSVNPTLGVNAAKQALLTFMVGGPDPKFPDAQEILQNMGKNVVHCGAVGTGQVGAGKLMRYIYTDMYLSLYTHKCHILLHL